MAKIDYELARREFVAAMSVAAVVARLLAVRATGSYARCTR